MVWGCAEGRPQTCETGCITNGSANESTRADKFSVQAFGPRSYAGSALTPGGANYTAGIRSKVIARPTLRGLPSTGTHASAAVRSLPSADAAFPN